MAVYQISIMLLFLSAAAAQSPTVCTTSSPCGLGKGDCDSSGDSSDCATGLVCGVNNCHSFVNNTQHPSYADCCEARNCSVVDELAWNCCGNPSKCTLGQGDCDSDDDCYGDLVCGIDNCGGSESDADCCMVLQCDGSQTAWDCCSSSKQCQENEGDCDGDDDCHGNLVCGKDNCIGGAADADCCTPTLKTGSELDWNACNSTNPCGENEGDCDDNSDCDGSLVCGVDNCHTINSGIISTTSDCCIQKVCDAQDEDWNCCSGFCGDMEGDCDTHDDCLTGYFCGEDNCPAGSATDADCCYKPDCDGGEHAWDCCKVTPCQEGEGDCDNDAECEGTLVCGVNNRPGTTADEDADFCKQP